MATKTVEKAPAKSGKTKSDRPAAGARSAKPAKAQRPAALRKPKVGDARPKLKAAVKPAAALKAQRGKTAPAKGVAKKPSPKTGARPALKSSSNAKAAPPAKTAGDAKPAVRPAKVAKAPEKAVGKKSPAAAAGKTKALPASGAPLKAGAPGKAAAPQAKPTKPVTKRKPMVGQKPRSAKPSDSIIPSTILAQQKAAPSVNTSSAKASPAAVEAKQEFRVNDHIVYPAHGVGRIAAIEKQVIAGITNELFLIEFEQEKMRLRVPTAKAKSVGMRGLSEGPVVKKAIELLKGRARIKRTMWSRRAQEYEQKINSGDILAVAEVVRDLFRASDQPEQSYSERQLFEAALDRLAREVAAVHKSDLAKAIGELEAALAAKKAAA